jgi:hypothetical protein
MSYPLFAGEEKLSQDELGKEINWEGLCEEHESRFDGNSYMQGYHKNRRLALEKVYRDRFSTFAKRQDNGRTVLIQLCFHCHWEIK